LRGDELRDIRSSLQQAPISYNCKRFHEFSLLK
jgi:hypothetical protein